MTTAPARQEHAERGDESRPAVRLQVTRGGEPSSQEMAAIVTAVLVTQPRPAAPSRPAPAPRWRFSGRWWSKPVPLRRARPH